MINIGEKAKVVINWVVQPVDFSREKADSIAHKFAKKYGIPKDNITVEPKFCVKNKDGEDVPLTNELITNIQDPKFQQMMFVKYAEDNGIEDFDAEAINTIDNQLNTQIDYEVYDKFKKYEAKWIKWGNFLSYGEDNYLDFTKLHGLIHLKGEPANESGKSTLAYDLLHFLRTVSCALVNNLHGNVAAVVQAGNHFLGVCVNCDNCVASIEQLRTSHPPNF